MDLRTKPIAESVTADEHDGPVRVVEYQPGNGTRYVLTIVELGGLARRALESIGVDGGWTVVVHNYRAAMTVRPDGYLGPHFVRPQLDCSIHDAVVIAEIVGHLLGVKHMTCEEFAAR